MFTPDYQTLIDGPTWAFIRATEAQTPADTATLTIADQRRLYDAMCRQFHHGHPPGITVTDISVAGIACRQYRPTVPAEEGPRVLYLHGGGFVVGGLESHDDICAEICAATGLQVLCVDYALCPEHPHPEAYRQCLAVAQALPGPLLLCGDSAGAALCASLALVLRGPHLLGQVLIYPGLRGPAPGPATGSRLRHAHAPLLSAEDLNFYADVRGARADDPTAYALAAADFSGLPPTLTIAAECDPLADDAVDYAAAITAAGGTALAVVEPGLVHGYLRARHSVPRAAASFARIPKTLSAFARGHWPGDDLI